MQNPRGSRPRRPLVLVVDDEPVARMVAADRLLVSGAEVVEASNGAEAMALLLARRFDLAIVDLDMPGLSGYDLIGCVRGHPRTRFLPVVVLTGNESIQALQRALSAGATSYLLKPLNWSAFGDHIQHILGLGQMGRQVSA